MEISFNFEDGTKPQDIAAKLRMQAGLFEGMTGKEASSIKNTSANMTKEEAEEKRVHQVKNGKIKTKSVTEDEFMDDDEDTEKTVNTEEDDAQVYDDEDENTEDTVNTDDTDDTESDENTDEEDNEDAPVETKKQAKPAKKSVKKLNLDDVNDACKKLALKIGGKAGREKVLAILKKKFKTSSVSELKADQYADAIAAMKV